MKGRNDPWGIEVTPSGTADVTVGVNGTTDCEAQHAACAADGGMLEGGAQAVVPGPALLSVVDARVEEDEKDFGRHRARARRLHRRLRHVDLRGQRDLADGFGGGAR